MTDHPCRRKADTSPIVTIADSPILRIIARAATTTICALLIFFGSRLITTLDSVVAVVGDMRIQMAVFGQQISSIARQAEKNAEDIRTFGERRADRGP